ncbi:MAG: OmpA family protein [Candidatus Sumerlaeia bacterium]|nr:OmpA family protein [Candidatus Sumerlaeia bacterium]
MRATRWALRGAPAAVLLAGLLVLGGCRGAKQPQPIRSVYPNPEATPAPANLPVDTGDAARAKTIAVADPNAPAPTPAPTPVATPAAARTDIPPMTKKQWESGDDIPLGARIAELPPVPFGFDSVELSNEARAIIDRAATYLKKDPSLRVVLRGHTDQRGSPEYNIALGERRSQAVRAALLEAGVAADRVETLSFGEDIPLAPGESDEDMARNRRVEFFVFRLTP